MLSSDQEISKLKYVNFIVKSTKFKFFIENILEEERIRRLSPKDRNNLALAEIEKIFEKMKKTYKILNEIRANNEDEDEDDYDVGYSRLDIDYLRKYEAKYGEFYINEIQYEIQKFERKFASFNIDKLKESFEELVRYREELRENYIRKVIARYRAEERKRKLRKEELAEFQRRHAEKSNRIIWQQMSENLREIKKQNSLSNGLNYQNSQTNLYSGKNQHSNSLNPPQEKKKRYIYQAPRVFSAIGKSGMPFKKSTALDIAKTNGRNQINEKMRKEGFKPTGDWIYGLPTYKKMDWGEEYKCEIQVSRSATKDVKHLYMDE